MESGGIEPRDRGSLRTRAAGRRGDDHRGQVRQQTAFLLQDHEDDNDDNEEERMSTTRRLGRTMRTTRQTTGEEGWVRAVPSCAGYAQISLLSCLRGFCF